MTTLEKYLKPCLAQFREVTESKYGNPHVISVSIEAWVARLGAQTALTYQDLRVFESPDQFPARAPVGIIRLANKDHQALLPPWSKPVDLVSEFFGARETGKLMTPATHIELKLLASDIHDQISTPEHMHLYLSITVNNT